MKKSILIMAITGLFLAIGTKVSAQEAATTTSSEPRVMVSKAVATELQKATTDAIAVVKNDAEIIDSDKKKFERRINTLLNSAMAKDDVKAKIEFTASYNKLAANFNKITGKTLPVLTIKTETAE